MQFIILAKLQKPDSLPSHVIVSFDPQIAIVKAREQRDSIQMYAGS